MWNQYDDEQAYCLDDEDFYMVVQDTILELSQHFGLLDEHLDLLTKLLDENFDDSFQKFQIEEEPMIAQRCFYDFMVDILKIYNEQVDKLDQPSLQITENPQEEEKSEDSEEDEEQREYLKGKIEQVKYQIEKFTNIEEYSKSIRCG